MSVPAIRDLTDPAPGPHAIQLILDEILDALGRRWPSTDVRLVRADPVVSLAENYWRLGYAPDAVTLDARYTRYVAEDRVLRSHTSALVPAALDALAGVSDIEVLLVCPGICYRRDAVDRLHTGTPHQLDLWLVTDRGPLTDADLQQMIDAVVAGALPGARWRTVATGHPYTVGGRQIDASVRLGDSGKDWGEDWVEVGECGLAAPAVLQGCGLGDNSTGLAMGLGLDRLLMLRKGIPDIRLMRSSDPRVAGQMLDLTPYRPVSVLPPVRRDVSIAVDPNSDISAEALGDRVREALGDDADAVEEVATLGVVGYTDLPDAARRRLGIRPGQRNLLVRIVLRPWERTLTDAEANELRDRIYAALHGGEQVAPPGAPR